MTVESAFTIPNDVSFQDAIALTQSLLDETEQGQVSESILEQTIRALVRTENGARGFFVTYLSDDRPLVEQMMPVVVQALKTSPEVVSPLLVKNLAMSTAMAISHRRNQNEDLAKGSDRVRSHTTALIQALSLPPLHEHVQQLAATIRTGAGKYQAFLERWSYDTEQKQAIYAALEQAGLVQGAH
ncbi:hypothetical protein [Leptothermofonsia sp. ETS-13]|uniref:hypothetical protein n=1 Tax=Leptothermofonsia sp. ETS-13 TaxID=3035696 RepID=UPI003BA12157